MPTALVPATVYSGQPIAPAPKPSPSKSPAAIRQYNIERYAATGARDYLLGSPIGFFGRRLFAKVNYNW